MKTEKIVLQKIDHRKVRIPKAGTKVNKQIDIMFWNIWVQFGIKRNVVRISRSMIKKYEWTSTARTEFYAILFHKKLLKLLENRKLRTSWIIDCEPLEINNIKQK